MSGLLRLGRVSKSFKGLKAVDEVSLEVFSGEILGLIGPNGAGKTTLFNLITGAFPPSEGCIFLDGRNITATAPQQRCQMGIARTFQMVRPFMQLSVLDNVTIGRLYGRDSTKNRRQAEAAARELLDLVGLAPRAADHAHSLTLVDRKRLELARALAARPRLLLLDELLAGLNPSEVLNAIKLIQAVREGAGGGSGSNGTERITIIMVEHMVKTVFNIADRIVVLSAGEKIAEGTPEAVSVDPLVIDAYLGKSLHVHLA